MTSEPSSCPRSFSIVLVCCLILLGILQSPGAIPLPPDVAYVQVGKEGFLKLDGKRVRYWGAVFNYIGMNGSGDLAIKPSDSPAERQKKIENLRQATDATADRLAGLGFNLVRAWDGFDPAKPYTMGDGSPQDMFAYACASYEKRGIKLWATQFNALGHVTEEDVAALDQPADAEAWKNAIKECNAKGPQDIRGAKFYATDPRTGALRLQRMKAWAEFPNHYKGGLRLGDDPQVVVWELGNEEWWFTGMANGGWQTWPKFFRDQVMTGWHDFLTRKYKTDEALRAAWGFLLPGETLAKKNILLAPLASPVNDLVLNDVNPLAIAAQTASAQKFTRSDFTRQRGADVIEFFLQAIIARKQLERDQVKTWGKSCKLSPLVFDTGDGFRIQTVYLHQLADAVTMCTYLEGFAHDKQEPRFPWFSYLDEPPRMSHDVPWSEIGRVPGKPFFLYETQMMAPSKYRAEYPYRLLAQGVVQDWDIIVWHCFPRPLNPDAPAVQPYNQALEVGHAGFPAEGFHFRFDEVQSAAMSTAATMFRQGSFQTVQNPTTFVFGKDLLYDPSSLDYGQSFGPYADKMTPTGFRYGLRMSVDPSLEKSTVKGALVIPSVHEGNPIRPTSEIEWDWRRSHLKMEAPTAAAYTGFFTQYGGPVRFASDQLTLSDVTVVNPPAAPYPVTPEENYIAFGIVALDGKPLPASGKIEVTLVSTSFNTGASIKADSLPGAANSRARLAGSEKGTAPVLVSRAGGRLTAPYLVGMSYSFVDWHFQEIGRGQVGPDGLLIPADQPIFRILLTR